MGVFRGRGAEVAALGISDQMRDAVRLWENAHILIIDPGPNSVYLRDKNPLAFIWDGMARVQPYRREVPAAAVGNPTTNQSVRFQVDFSKDGVIPDIKTGWRVLVLNDVEIPDPYISEYEHIVNSALNSSLAWVRTIETQVNTESRPSYQIEPNGLGGFQWQA
jgi:hypothetical protein